MTPTLLSASSAAYLSSPATASDGSPASVDGSAISGPASDGSSVDHRDDVAPNDFAVLLAAMMATAVPSPLRPRPEPGDASSSPTAGNGVAATSSGLATPVPLMSAGVGTSGVSLIALEVDIESSAGVSTLTPSIASASTGTAPDTADSTPAHPLGVTQALSGEDPAVGRTATTSTEGADASRVDGVIESVRASSMTGRETPVPSFGLVALDRPMSFGRETTPRTVRLSDATVADGPLTSEDGPAISVSLSVTGGPLAIDLAPTAGVSSPVDGPAAKDVAPILPTSIASPTAESIAMLSDGGSTAAMVAAFSGQPTLATPSRMGSSVPRPGTADELDVVSSRNVATPMSVESDASALAAPTEVAQGSAGARADAGSEVTELPAQVLSSAGTTRVSRDKPSAAKDAGADPSAVGVPTGPNHAPLTDRAGSFEAPTLTVAEGVRPSDASQHIVRAAQRAQAADGPQHMRLEMHPGDLGAVAVDVTIEDGAVHVAMVAERGETKDLLRSSIAELRSSLVAAGFSAGRVDIQSGLSDGRFGRAADRHDAWSQSFDRPDSRRDQSGAFANMFDQTSGRGDQSRSSRPFAEVGDRRDPSSALRGVRGSDRLLPDPATTPKGPRRDRLDVQL